jgi:hypothetical protein
MKKRRKSARRRFPAGHFTPPRQNLLAQRGFHQGRRDSLLRQSGRRDPTLSSQSADGPESAPQRHPRRELFSKERRSEAPAAVRENDCCARPQHGSQRALCGLQQQADAALSCQSRLRRDASLDSRIATIKQPDFLSLDLDPGGNPFSDIVSVARTVRKVVEEAGGSCLVKTSGKTGIHVIVPLRARHDFAEVRGVAKIIARLVNRRLPKLTTRRPNAGRHSRKIYIDYVRNSFWSNPRGALLVTGVSGSNRLDSARVARTE